ncbi:MAG: metal-dependent transcriptional regulator [Candidatus Latescibacteria bacterium]|nr:metal-dependent transcriptional regulator [Candidatus Latescibacterota bacterium]
MVLSPSMEDYLEAIFEIEKNKRAVRVKDVSEKLGVTMSSVNGALKNLEAKGLINHEKYEYIELTETGTTQASRISTRHQVIYTFLREILGVNHDTAENDACKIEHVLSPQTMKKLKRYITDEGRRVKGKSKNL